MRGVSERGRALPLVLDLGSGTAIVDGERIELPPREFKLLVELASRAGAAVATPKLISAVWPEAPDTPAQELYVLIGRLRKFLGEDKRENKLLRNRRRFGYYLALEPHDVVLADGSEAAARALSTDVTDDTSTQDLDEPVAAGHGHHAAAPSAQTNELSAKAVGSSARRRIRPVAITAAVVASALLASWSAGFMLARWRAERSVNPRVARSDTSPDHERDGGDTDGKSARKRRARPDRNDKTRRPKQRSRRAQPGVGDGPGVAAAGTLSGPADAPASASAPVKQANRRGGGHSKNRHPATEPALPAAPTRYLYHLVHPETGDHFVTTDGNVASTYEGKGYEGGPIGRVYTSRPEGVATRAIATNYGTAYVFSGSSPKTKPASTTWRLYYSTNNDGDFFYTTSAGEAQQTGWDGVLIGYVRTL